MKPTLTLWHQGSDPFNIGNPPAIEPEIKPVQVHRQVALANTVEDSTHPSFQLTLVIAYCLRVNVTPNAHDLATHNLVE